MLEEERAKQHARVMIIILQIVCWYWVYGCFVKNRFSTLVYTEEWGFGACRKRCCIPYNYSFNGMCPKIHSMGASTLIIFLSWPFLPAAVVFWCWILAIHVYRTKQWEFRDYNQTATFSFFSIESWNCIARDCWAVTVTHWKCILQVAEK